MKTLAKDISDLQIVDYDPRYQKDFKSLNLAWIEKYFEVEDIDHKVLSFPDEYIYKDGGVILMALLGEKVVGTVALKRLSKQVLEMTKMAVDTNFQGAKVGHHLAVAAIAKAKEMGAKELVLYSQTLLVPAIKLYKKLGFKEVPMEAGKYKRSNIKMKISYLEQEIIATLTKNFRQVLEETMFQFKTIGEAQWNLKPELKKWSRKEILGHLIDSASNNHQRFVRMQYMENLAFPGYEQDQWVNLQNHQNLPVSELLNLWYFYNLHLCNVVANIHYDSLYLSCTINNGMPISLHDLILDYISHLKHHVDQIM